MERSRLTQFSPAERDAAWQRFQLLRPHLEDGVPLTELARSAGFRCARPSAGSPSTTSTG